MAHIVAVVPKSDLGSPIMYLTQVCRSFDHNSTNIHGPPDAVQLKLVPFRKLSKFHTGSDAVWYQVPFWRYDFLSSDCNFNTLGLGYLHITTVQTGIPLFLGVFQVTQFQDYYRK